jgi:hypothetical protein
MHGSSRIIGVTLPGTELCWGHDNYSETIEEAKKVKFRLPNGGETTAV